MTDGAPVEGKDLPLAFFNKVFDNSRHSTGYTDDDFRNTPVDKFFPPEKLAERGFVNASVKMDVKSGELKDFSIRAYVIQREPAHELGNALQSCQFNLHLLELDEASTLSPFALTRLEKAQKAANHRQQVIRNARRYVAAENAASSFISLGNVTPDALQTPDPALATMEPCRTLRKPLLEALL